jgi:hypothetical protein
MLLPELLFFLVARLADALGSLGVELTPLLNLGAVGAIAGYLLLKNEPRLKGVEQAVDRLTRGLMLSVLANEHASLQQKAQATELLQELHDAEERRRDGRPPP